MILALGVGILVGIIVAIPPGPLGFVIIKNTLQHGKKRGLVIGAGTSVMDFIYCLFFIFATGSIFSSISSYLEQYSHLFLLFQICCVLGFIVYGWYNVRNRSIAEADSASNSQPRKTKIVRELAQRGPFILGLGLAVTQLANPTFAPFMTYLSLFVHEQGLVHPETFEWLFFATGYAVGIFTWIYILVGLSLRYRKVLSAEFIRRLNQLVGYTMIGFGTYLGYRVGMLIKWMDVFRLVVAL